MSKVTNTIRQKAEDGFNEVKISYIEPNGCAAEGTGTIASGKNQHVQGRWNEALSSEPDYDESGNIIDYGYAHIVGNGTDDSNRSNIHTLGWDGSAWYQGPLTLGVKNNEKPKNPLLEVYGDISIDGDIIANGSTLQMDKLYAIKNKPNNNEHYLFNRFEEATGVMHIYPLEKNITSGETYSSTAILGIQGASFEDAYLDALTFVGRGKDTGNRIESKIELSREAVFYRYQEGGATSKKEEWVNVLNLKTENAEGEPDNAHGRFFIRDFFGVGSFDVYSDAHFQSSVSVSNTDDAGRAVLSFKKENGKKYLEISFLDADS